MRLTFLGTGAAMPVPERRQTGLLFEGGEEPLLVDCGAGVLHRLTETPVGYEGVSTVLLTHHHLDHVADLLPLLKARWLAGEEELTVAGPEGTPDLVRDLLDVHDYLDGRVDLTLRTVEPGEFEVAGYRVRATETRHSVPCLAYRVHVADHPDAGADPAAGGRLPPTVTYSGDSEAVPELVAFADGSALLVHDCSFPDGVEVSNHPTPTDLGAAVAAADATLGRLYLTHLYPHAEGETERMVAAVRDQVDDVDVRVAEDLRTVTVE
jgi:ribonuclease BN (tRNA processing enzyme)